VKAMALPHIYRDTNRYFTAVYKNAKIGEPHSKINPITGLDRP